MRALLGGEGGQVRLEDIDVVSNGGVEVGWVCSRPTTPPHSYNTPTPVLGVDEVSV